MARILKTAVPDLLRVADLALVDVGVMAAEAELLGALHKSSNLFAGFNTRHKLDEILLRMNVELLINRFDMTFDGILRHQKFLGYDLVAPAFR